MKNPFNNPQTTINLQFSKVLQERLKLPKNISIQLPESITTLTQFIEYLKKPSHLRRFKAWYWKDEKAKCLEILKWLFEDYSNGNIEINECILRDLIEIPKSNAPEASQYISEGKTLKIDLENVSMMFFPIRLREVAKFNYKENIYDAPSRLLACTLIGALLGTLATWKLPNDIRKAPIISLFTLYATSLGLSLIISNIIDSPPRLSIQADGGYCNNGIYRPLEGVWPHP